MAQLAQVARWIAALIVEVIGGTSLSLVQTLVQASLLLAGMKPEVIISPDGVGECCRNQPIDPSYFSDIGPLLATTLHEHLRLRKMNVQFLTQTVRAMAIGADTYTLSLSGNTI